MRTREMIEELRADVCNVVVSPSTGPKRHCALEPRGQGEDGRTKCKFHLKEEGAELEHEDERLALELWMQAMSVRFGELGFPAEHVRVGSVGTTGPGGYFDPTITFTGEVAQQILAALVQ